MSALHSRLHLYVQHVDVFKRLVALGVSLHLRAHIHTHAHTLVHTQRNIGKNISTGRRSSR